MFYMNVRNFETVINGFYTIRKKKKVLMQAFKNRTIQYFSNLNGKRCLKFANNPDI